jgi:hypothetical protein
VAQSPRVFLETQIPESFQPDPSHERDQKQKGSEENGSTKESLKVCLGEKLEVVETGRDLAGPEQPRGKYCAQRDGSN